MQESNNHEIKNWEEHGVTNYNKLINDLLNESTGSKNLTQEEKSYITQSLHTDVSIPYYKADRFVGSAQVTPYQKIKQYLLEVQSRQQLVEYNEYEVAKKEIEIERDEAFYNTLEKNSYDARILKLEIEEQYRKLRQFKVNLRHVQQERNNYLRLIKEFNESPQGKHTDGRLLIEVLDDKQECEKLEKQHWTYRMAKQTALDWMAYGRPGVGNMDAVLQMNGEQQEEVLKLAIELFARNEIRVNRLTDEVHQKIKEGLPPSTGAQLLEITEQENVHHIQSRNRTAITQHNPSDW